MRKVNHAEPEDDLSDEELACLERGLQRDHLKDEAADIVFDAAAAATPPRKRSALTLRRPFGFANRPLHPPTAATLTCALIEHLKDCLRCERTVTCHGDVSAKELAEHRISARTHLSVLRTLKYVHEELTSSYPEPRDPKYAQAAHTRSRRN
jgi:hypothetical protein